MKREFACASHFNPDYDGSRVQVYDSTLRDGEQMPGVAFDTEDKIAIAKALDDARVPEIEAGFPSVSPTEFETIKSIIDLDLDADILVLSRCCEPDLDRVRKLEIDLVMLFIATSDIHLMDKLHMDRQQVMDKASRAFDFCKDQGIPFSFSSEDTTRSDLSYVRDLNWMAVEHGAKRVGVTDTVGCATPDAMEHIVSFLREDLPCHLSVHCHNDFGLANANAIAAVMAGATHVATTVNGIGERAGNVPLQEFVLTLEALYNVTTGLDLTRLTPVSELVSRLSGVPLHPNQPITGRNVFSHESGIHVAAVFNNPFTYEPLTPESVGNERRIIMGKHTGHRAVRHVLHERGLEFTNEQLEHILSEVKRRGEAEGHVPWSEFWVMVEETLDS